MHGNRKVVSGGGVPVLAFLSLLTAALLLSGLSCGGGPGVDSLPQQENRLSDEGAVCDPNDAQQAECFDDCPTSVGCCPSGQPYGCLDAMSDCEFTACNAQGSCCSMPTGAQLTGLKITNRSGGPVSVVIKPPAYPGGTCTNLQSVNGTYALRDNESTSFAGEAGMNLCGTILFGGDFTGCPEPEGFTQGEFSLNVNGLGIDAGVSETVDISLVNGTNGKVSVHLPGGWYWTTLADQGVRHPISQLGPNADLGKTNPAGKSNAQLPGVYPNSCDVCSARQAEPCPQFIGKGDDCKQPSDPACQVDRTTNLIGGQVEFVWEGAF